MSTLRMRLKYWILNRILKHLFKTSINNSLKVIIHDRVNTGYAIELLENPLFQKILETVRYDAQSNMYNNCTQLDHIVFPKAMLYTVHEIEKKVRSLSKAIDIKQTNTKW